jgi:hypothetical protein
VRLKSLWPFSEEGRKAREEESGFSPFAFFAVFCESIPQPGTVNREVWALAVKSGRAGRLSGLAAFRARYPRAHALAVGGQGIPLDDFFARSPADFLEA